MQLADRLNAFAREIDLARHNGAVEQPLGHDDEQALTRAVSFLLTAVWNVLREARVSRRTSYGSVGRNPFDGITGPLSGAVKAAHAHRDSLPSKRPGS